MVSWFLSDGGRWNVSRCTIKHFATSAIRIASQGTSVATLTEGGQKSVETTKVYWGYIEIMEKKIEATI